MKREVGYTGIWDLIFLNSCVHLRLKPNTTIAWYTDTDRDYFADGILFTFILEDSHIVNVTMDVTFQSKVCKEIAPIHIDDLRPYGLKKEEYNPWYRVGNLEEIISRVIPDDVVCLFGEDGRYRDCDFALIKPDNTKIIGEKKGDCNFVRLSGTNEWGHPINHKSFTRLSKDGYMLIDILRAFNNHLWRFSNYKFIFMP